MDKQVPALWEKAAAYLSLKAPARVLLLGATDTGKSTLAFFLAERLLSAGLSVALVDADVGQKDVGPPATVALAHLKQPLPEKRPLEAETLYFVGSVTPVGHLLPMVVGTRQLVDQSKAQVTIINTTGLVRGPGIALKSFQIESLRPEVILALPRQEELEPILAAYRYLEILRLPVPPQAVPKGPALRRARRMAAFRQHFARAKTWAFVRDELIFQRLPRGGLRPGLLCAVANHKAEVKALALVERLEPQTGRIYLLTPAPPQEVAVVICGSLYLNRLGEELGRLVPGSKAPKARLDPCPRRRSPRVWSPPGERSPRPRSPGFGQRPTRRRSRPGPRGRSAPETGE